MCACECVSARLGGRRESSNWVCVTLFIDEPDSFFFTIPTGTLYEKSHSFYTYITVVVQFETYFDHFSTFSKFRLNSSVSHNFLKKNSHERHACGQFLADRVESPGKRINFVAWCTSTCVHDSCNGTVRLILRFFSEIKVFWIHEFITKTQNTDIWIKQINAYNLSMWIHLPIPVLSLSTLFKFIVG